MKRESISFRPIGFLRSSRQHKSAAGRQPQNAPAAATLEAAMTSGRSTEAKASDVSAMVPTADATARMFSTTAVDVIQLNKGQRFEQALEELSGFSHLWLIFHFDQAPSWKPKVQPPRGSDKKVGVFASRSPYRPNPLGLSLVRLLEVRGLQLTLAPTDLLDGTPILDIKPYVANSDSVSDSRSGWMDFLKTQALAFEFSDRARAQLEFVKAAGLDLQTIVIQQLERDPFNRSSKRVRRRVDESGEFSYRLWRIDFRHEGDVIYVDKIDHVFHINVDEKLKSRLSPNEIEIYQSFRRRFASQNATK